MPPSSPIRLIVGLGNPGDEYTRTRHNAGVWFVEKVAAQYHVTLRHEKKFHGMHGCFIDGNAGEKIHLLIPSTFMNHSGQALRAITDFYEIPPESILITHDELDIPIGDIRLKFGGGHGGHNGLRDIISHLQSPDFYRLRIGIAHPGESHKVVDYVLNQPSKEERNKIDSAIDKALNILSYMFNSENEKAMQILHTGKV